MSDYFGLGQLATGLDVLFGEAAARPKLHRNIVAQESLPAVGRTEDGTPQTARCRSPASLTHGLHVEGCASGHDDSARQVDRAKLLRPHGQLCA